LDAGEPASQVWAVFSWSYRTLSPSAARLFRLLGLHPGPDLSTAAAASLVGAGVEPVRAGLTELTRASLLTEHTPGRYIVHDLLRAYAADLAADEDSAAGRRAAQHRVLDHYVHTASKAARLLDPHRIPIELTPAQPGVTNDPPPDSDGALAWLAAEHVVLLNAATVATDSGFDDYVAPLAWSLSEFLCRRNQWDDHVAIHLLMLDAARRLGDHQGEARAHRLLGRGYTLLGSYSDAEAHYQCALELSGRLDDRNGLAHTHMNLANMHGDQGRHDLALANAKQAVDLFRVAGSRSGEARALNSMGWSHARLGNHEMALVICGQAMDLLLELDDQFGQAHTLDSLGYIYLHLGDHSRAIASLRRAVELQSGFGDRYHEADALIKLGDAYDAAGDRPAARHAWRRAVALLEEIGHPQADEVRARLTPARS
jgi:tetratricopeptide (TPR) repeat protein